MQLLHLAIDTPGRTVPEATVRALASDAPAPVHGLRARWWRAVPQGLVGRYLFDDVSQGVWSRALAEDRLGNVLRSFGTEEQTTSFIDEQRSTLDRPVFIVSAPRSGSTLLHELLALADGAWSVDGGMQAIVDGVPELHLARRGYESQALDDQDADPKTTATLRAAMLAALRPSSGAPFARLSPTARPRRVRALEACPENALRIAFLRTVFPDALFIFLQRDLRQNISSMVEAWSHPGFVAIDDLPGFSRRQWCFLLPEGWRRYADASITEIAGFQWGAANRAIVHELGAMPRSQWTTVTYDELVATPAQEIERLCEFIEIPVGARLRKMLAHPLPLSSTTLTPPSPVKWRSNAAFDAEKVTGLQPLAGTMRALRIEQSQPVLRTSQATATRFACFADELEPADECDDVVVAPSLEVQLGQAVPLRLLPVVQHRERFLTDHPVLWVEDTAFGVWTPTWLRQKDAWWCRQLRPNDPVPPHLDRRLRGQLVRAGVLVPPGALEERRRHGASHLRRAPDVMQRLRYYVVPALLPGAMTNALAGYYRSLIDAGEWPLGDDQVARRHGWHDERVARFVHLQLTPVVSALANVAVKPTYSFASAYRGGAQLGAHTDREQCELTLSVMVDEVKRPGESWPLRLLTDDGQRSVHLGVGDACLFRGCELPHWREAAAPDHEQINLLFHFVPASWRGVLQ